MQGRTIFAAGRLQWIDRTFWLLLWPGLLLLAGFWLFQPDPRDDLRQADRLFAVGRYHAALPLYQQLAAEQDDAGLALRLGILRTLRGEYALAEPALRHAIKLGLPPAKHDLAVIYLGQALFLRDQPLPAARAWNLVRACTTADCAYDVPRRVLRAEAALRRGDYAAAESDYRAALNAPYFAEWQALARLRLAILLAARDPAAALATLQRPLPDTAEVPYRLQFLLEPLRPALPANPNQLAAILQTSLPERDQLLGQFYLDLQHYDLAETQFARIDPAAPQAIAAAAYAAYADWRAGNARESIARLEELIALHPLERRPRILLALIYVTDRDDAAAHTQLEAVTVLAPGNADVSLGWAGWHVARRDYVAAAAEYQRALAVAPAGRRGDIALMVARFHLDTTYELCSTGLPTARRAVTLRPTDPAALTVLAAGHFHCGEFAAAASTAAAAFALKPDSQAAYYLGAARSALGDTQGARSALITAADLAPASPWRNLAEERLALLP
jgi:Flp pilus assembly protein TadD